MFLHKRRRNLFASLIALGLLAFSGCQTADKQLAETAPQDVSKEVQSLPQVSQTTQKVLSKNQVLEIALPTDSQLSNFWANEFIEDKLGDLVFEFMNEPLFALDSSFKFTSGGLAEIVFDPAENTATMTLKKDLKWSDGSPVTIADVIFPYEIIGHPDYQGVRYDESFENIIGMQAYHRGETQNISGIQQIDDYQAVFHYQRLNSDMWYGAGICNYASPKHYLAEVPVKDLQNSQQIRENPVVLGPYCLKSASLKEIEFQRNPYYHLGLAQAAKIHLTLVPVAEITEALENEKYDIALNMPSDSYKDYRAIEGYQNLGREELYYSYLGFKFGHYDNDLETVVTDEQAKMNNLNLRKAMAYALDIKKITQNAYSGVRPVANSVILPVFSQLHGKNISTYQQDVEKAKALLAEAGYVDVNHDGYLDKPDGTDLTIYFAAMKGQQSSEEVANYFKNCWDAIGLKVEFTSGKLLEMSEFYDLLRRDAPDVDVYLAAWGVDTNPNPTDTFSRTTPYNFMRFSSPELEKILGKINSAESQNADYQKAAYLEFQEYLYETLPVLPLNYNYRVALVHDRVANFNYSYVMEQAGNRWYYVGVTRTNR